MKFNETTVTNIIFVWISVIIMGALLNIIVFLTKIHYAIVMSIFTLGFLCAYFGIKAENKLKKRLGEKS